jgi:predicted SnoaL-like aldol condensation-catalyzing enzyme
MLAMEESGEKFPNKVIKIIHLVQDGDTVAIHSHIKMNPHDLGYAMMHIFRFENDKIMELWDFGQQVPDDCVNENGMF